MKSPLIALAVVSAFAVAGCETQNQTQGAILGAATGAAVGGLTTGSVGGALIGGATGAVAGNLIGRVADSQTDCVYRDANGNRYVAKCP